MTVYETQGTCSKAIQFEISPDGKLTHCQFLGGCPGNTQGVCRLAIGRDAAEVAAMLKGVQCRNGTSCPDQLARAIEQELAK